MKLIRNFFRRIAFLLHLEKGLIFDMATHLCPKGQILDLGEMYISHREIDRYEREGIYDSRVTINVNENKVYSCAYIFLEIYHVEYYRYLRDYNWFKMLCEVYDRAH